MPAAGPEVTPQDMDDAYSKEFCAMTFEGKPDDYRRLNGVPTDVVNVVVAQMDFLRQLFSV
jgi:hypothetical protein